MALNLGVAPAPRDTLPVPAPTDPFRLALLADFSGRNGDFASVKPVPLNSDDFDAALAKIGPDVALDGLPGDPTVAPRSLDDFEPDALIRAIDHFSDCSGEEEKGEFLDSVLHHPNFRRVESAWRGVDWLARRGRKGGRQVEIVLYDVSAENFAAAFAGEALAESDAYRVLVEDAVYGKKGKPWGAVVGFYDYDPTAANAELLGRVARTLTDCGGPFLAGLSPDATDPGASIEESDKEAWAELRGMPEAALIGLATPRFLARRPYGENYRQPEDFSYEEFRGDPGVYAWAPAALVPAGALAQGYIADGWGFGAQGTRTLEEMTTHAYTDSDDDDHLTLLDRWLDRKAAERLTGLGVMTAQAVKSRDVCQLTRLHSIGGTAAPTDLYGRWGKSASAGPPRSKFGVSVVMDSAMTGTAPKAAASKAAASKAAASDSGEPPSADASSFDAPSSDAPSGGDDLAAMMAALDSPGDAPTDGAPTEEPAMDSDLAAMMAALDAPSEPSPEPASGDDDIAAMLAALDAPMPDEPTT